MGEFDFSPENIKRAIILIRKNEEKNIRYNFREIVNEVEYLGGGQMKKNVLYEKAIQTEHDKIKKNLLGEWWIHSAHPDVESPEGLERLVSFIRNLKDFYGFDRIASSSMREFEYSQKMISLLKGWKDRIRIPEERMDDNLAENIERANCILSLLKDHISKENLAQIIEDVEHIILRSELPQIYPLCEQDLKKVQLRTKFGHDTAGMIYLFYRINEELQPKRKTLFVDYILLKFPFLPWSRTTIISNFTDPENRVVVFTKSLIDSTLL